MHSGITDFGAKCEKCETINTITLEEGRLKKQLWFRKPQEPLLCTKIENPLRSLCRIRFYATNSLALDIGLDNELCASVEC